MAARVSKQVRMHARCPRALAAPIDARHAHAVDVAVQGPGRPARRDAALPPWRQGRRRHSRRGDHPELGRRRPDR
eukprot:2402843-Prymnesium_polylepis.1